ncbi:hypothetical protein SAMN04488020_104278 [Palleronia marisminoris]|uniref:Uncharacterized protein n=1 Tax=Palleronia marisminoris TaxID=315423 RepID=A0A1Y5SR28_9RHOB|nr:hypothetical protein [Palleronia marisminoris]SFG88072.1 hypothetical protein SAMN04488020_104278 [Palleronia marisminoris]SLN43379.1 hypothetical protein PAM7066_01901 [Palleronia marisminoris]
MIVLDAAFDHVRRDRDFGRVEAYVTLLIKRAGEAARPVRVRTNVTDRGTQTLRVRLLENAASLADYVMRRDASGQMDHAA